MKCSYLPFVSRLVSSQGRHPHRTTSIDILALQEANFGWTSRGKSLHLEHVTDHLWEMRFDSLNILEGHWANRISFHVLRIGRLASC